VEKLKKFLKFKYSSEKFYSKLCCDCAGGFAELEHLPCQVEVGAYTTEWSLFQLIKTILMLCIFGLKVSFVHAIHL